MSEVGDDGTVTSLVSGRHSRSRRKIVDATYSHTSVPSMRAPQYAVATGIACVAPNALARVTKAHTGYVVIGSGKTGLDTVIWLLENGVDPDKSTGSGRAITGG